MRTVSLRKLGQDRSQDALRSLLRAIILLFKVYLSSVSKPGEEICFGDWKRRIDNRQSIPRMQRMNAIFRIK